MLITSGTAIPQNKSLKTKHSALSFKLAYRVFVTAQISTVQNPVINLELNQF